MKKSSSGNKGQTIRSDCFVSIETEVKENEIIINSKVEKLYGQSIHELVSEMIQFFDLKNIRITIEDTGSLPFVIAARVESAVKKLYDTDKQFLLPLNQSNKNESEKAAFRFSRLYLPGNSPKLMINAGIHKPNGIILDLEDSVAPEKKSEARFLVRNALRSVDFYGAERMVRINQIPDGIEDLDYIVPHNVNMILIPKVEDAAQVKLVEDHINKTEHKNPIWLMPIIESAKGVMNAYEIAKSSSLIASMAIGLEDYTADIGTTRTQSGNESLFARNMLVNACKAAGIQPIDSVYSDIDNTVGLIENVKQSKSLGFEGMGCIHPRQIPVIHEYFLPEHDEIERAKKIVMAYEQAEKEGKGVVALGSKMIDPPVVKRALKIIALALSSNLVQKNWRDDT